MHPFHWRSIFFQCDLIISLTDDMISWVYKHKFVADSNFKADHVLQKSEADVWLSEGSGMFLKRDEYFTFFATAIENLRVGKNYFNIIQHLYQLCITGTTGANYGWIYFLFQIDFLAP